MKSIQYTIDAQEVRCHTPYANLEQFKADLLQAIQTDYPAIPVRVTLSEGPVPDSQQLQVHIDNVEADYDWMQEAEEGIRLIVAGIEVSESVENAVEAVREWNGNVQRVEELRDLINAAKALEEEQECKGALDRVMTSLNSASEYEAHAALTHHRDYPVWAVDSYADALVGESADQIEDADDIVDHYAK